MISEQYVLDAVAKNKITTSQGLLQRAFAVWFDAFVYNQIWEDPRVDLRALDIRPDSRILCISSGGCNVLNYLIENPESITAVDLNRYHIYLLRLTLAALRYPLTMTFLSSLERESPQTIIRNTESTFGKVLIRTPSNFGR